MSSTEKIACGYCDKNTLSGDVKSRPKGYIPAISCPYCNAEWDAKYRVDSNSGETLTTYHLNSHYQGVKKIHSKENIQGISLIILLYVFLANLWNLPVPAILEILALFSAIAIIIIWADEYNSPEEREKRRVEKWKQDRMKREKEEQESMRNFTWDGKYRKGFLRSLFTIEPNDFEDSDL